MTYTLDMPTLESAIVRQCAPTLAGMKPASLFTFPGSFVAEDSARQGEVDARRAALLELMEGCREELSPAGLELRVLAWRSCGALIYVYRPRQLSRSLQDPRAATRLEAEGYDVGDIDACLDLLEERVTASGKRTAASSLGAREGTCPCEREECAQEFPHEIGFFLGYPYEDVAGFIDHKGRDYLAVGLWKVYGDCDRAMATFARYRRCTSAYEVAYRRHGRLSRLAVRTR